MNGLVKHGKTNGYIPIQGASKCITSKRSWGSVLSRLQSRRIIRYLQLAILFVVITLCVLYRDNGVPESAIMEEYRRDVADSQRLAASRHINTVPEKNANCKTIHIAIKCIGAKELRSLSDLIKSILWHTHSPITLHVITDAIGTQSLHKLYETWNIPYLYLTTYKYSDVKGPSDPLMNTLSHLIASPDINMDKLDRLIVLKSHLFVTVDVDVLVAKFSNFRNNQMMAVVSSHGEGMASLEYLPESLLRVKTTYDVLLVDLSKFKQSPPVMNGLLCQKLCDGTEMPYDFKLTLGLYCIHHPEDGVEVVIKNTYKSPNGTIDIVRFPGIYDSQLLNGDYPSPPVEEHQQIANFDGDIFRTRKVYDSGDCGYNQTVIPVPRNATCYTYRYQAAMPRRTFMYFHYHQKHIDAMMDPASDDVTLTTQLQYNRLEGLRRLIKYWTGPFHVVLYLSDEEAMLFSQKIIGDEYFDRENVVYHVIYKRQTVHYPINYLRNLAIKEVKTPYLFVIDVDFVPKPDLYSYLRKEILSKLVKKTRALLIPTFETLNATYQVATNKEQLIKDWDKGQVESYHQRKGMWIYGHSNHNYQKWRTADSPYRVRWQFGFEPYMVLYTQGVSLYPEPLLERMRDKLSYTYEIYYRGFAMFVLDNAWVIHLPHKPSDSHNWKNDQTFKDCSKILYEEAVSKTERTYPRPSLKTFPIRKISGS